MFLKLLERGKKSLWYNFIWKYIPKQADKKFQVRLDIDIAYLSKKLQSPRF